MRILLLESVRRTPKPTREGKRRMKFELVEPSDEGAAAGLPLLAPVGPGTGVREQDVTFPEPVRERMARTVDGVRASLGLLRARAAEQSMAEAHSAAAPAPVAEAGAVFHAHRFAAEAPGKDDR
jgi:hypothetical protein